MIKPKSVRFTVGLPVSLCSDARQAEGTVVDISREGCRIQCPDSLEIGEFLCLYIVVPSHFLPVTVGVSAVRWATTTELGVEFIRMPPAQQKRLDTLLGLPLGLLA
jgi:c-di-GMP-binding flagellar brake protein YcgR